MAARQGGHSIVCGAGDERGHSLLNLSKSRRDSSRAACDTVGEVFSNRPDMRGSAFHKSDFVLGLAEAAEIL